MKRGKGGDEPEVFALLVSVYHFLARQGVSDFSSGSADFPKDIDIVLSLDYGESLAHEALSKVVNDARN